MSAKKLPLPPALAEVRRIDDAIDQVILKAEALIAFEDKHSECDHKRVDCKEIGCVGHEIRELREAIAQYRSLT